MADPGFPRGGRQPQRLGRQPITLANCPPKLHGNETILPREWMHAPGVSHPLDPPN